MALPLALGAIASVAAPVIGGLLGREASRGAADRSMAASQAALAALEGVNVPNIEEMKLALQNYLDVGDYNPLVEEALQLGQSAIEQVQVDPRLRQEQMKALQTLSEKAGGGLTQADLAGFELARRNAASEAQSREQRILQDLAQRGQAGGGAEIALRAISNQEAADRQAMQDLEMASRQEAARMQALQSLGQTAGSLRQQDYGEQMNLAQARDAMEKFNLMNRQDVGQRNVASRNVAQQMNLADRQRLAEANVNLANQQQQFNKALQQQQFENQLRRATGVAGQQQNMANVFANQAAQTQGMYSGIGSAIGTGAAGIFGQMANRPSAQPVTPDIAGGTTQYSADYLKRR